MDRVHGGAVRVCIAALAACVAAQAQTPIFDGKTTAGWVEVTGKPFPATCWTIEDHCLKAFPNANGQQDIRTTESFGSFDFEFEFKLLEHGNSGVKYLIQKVDEWVNKAGRQARARAPEFQLADDAGPEASSDPRRASGSLYSVIAPQGHVRTKIGEFNTARLVVRGEHVEHWLNGTKVVEYETSGPEARVLFESLRKGRDAAFGTRSPISLQNHGTPVWFRNLKIKHLE